MSTFQSLSGIEKAVMLMELHLNRRLDRIEGTQKQQGEEIREIKGMVAEVLAIVREIRDDLKPKPAVKATITVENIETGESHQGENLNMDVKRTAKFRASVTYKDADGVPTTAENEKWSSSDESLGTATPDPDNPGSVILDFTPTAPVGADIVFTATADGKLGEGESIITSSVAFHLLPGDAVEGSINVSPIE